MGHVLGVKLAATEGTSGGDDRTFPIGETVSRLDFQCTHEDSESDILHSETAPCPDQTGGYVMRQRVGPRRARRLHIEFLQHLHRQRPDVPLQQVDRPLPLCRFGRMTTYGVEQNIGIEDVW